MTLKGRPGLTEAGGEGQAIREVAVPNKQGMHARPVMRFVDLASRYQCKISVTNISGKRLEKVDGKSAMEMMLLEAAQGCVLRIEAQGGDAEEAVSALAALVNAGFGMDGCQEWNS